MTTVLNWVTAAALIAIILIVGGMDYDDQVRAEQLYIENVCSGIHPDYAQRGVRCDP